MNDHSWSDNSIDASQHTHLHESESETQNSDEINGGGTHGSKAGCEGMDHREAPSGGDVEQPEVGVGGGDTGEGMGRREEPNETGSEAPSGSGYEAPSGRCRLKR